MVMDMQVNANSSEISMTSHPLSFVASSLCHPRITFNVIYRRSETKNHSKRKEKR